MLYAADVSFYQPQVNNSYTRQWLIIRCCDGSYMDPNAAGNADWCRGAVLEHRMVGWTAYVVYRPGMNASVLENLTRIAPLDRVMIDVESWGGQITGNHSAEINALADAIGAAVGQGNVWVYGNQGDLAAIDPGNQRLTVVASYGPDRPNVPNMVGWQYTNGSVASGSRPTASAPFGFCDHNELYVDQLAPSGGGSLIGGFALDRTDPDVQALMLMVSSFNATEAFGPNAFSTAMKQAADTRTRILDIESRVTTPAPIDVPKLAAAIAAALASGLSKADVQSAVTAALEGLTFGVKP